MEGQIFFHALFSRCPNNRHVSMVEWAPVEVDLSGVSRREPDRYNKAIASWATDLVEGPDGELPVGLSAALVRMWSSKGMDDWDGGIELLAHRPVPPVDWRHTLSPMLTEYHEGRRAWFIEHNAHMDNLIAEQGREERAAIAAREEARRQPGHVPCPECADAAWQLRSPGGHPFGRLPIEMPCQACNHGGRIPPARDRAAVEVAPRERCGHPSTATGCVPCGRERAAAANVEGRA